MIDVSIILINYRTAQLTKQAIDSVKQKSEGFNYEIIVVDNSDDQQEFEELTSICIGASLLNPQKNLGFGKGNNLGASVAKGKYLLFLNTDTILINNAIYEMYSFLQNNLSVGIVGGNLYQRNNAPNHSAVFKEKNIKNEKSMFSFKGYLLKKLLNKRPDFNYTNKPMEVMGYICGADLMIRRDIFFKLNGFDNEIFMYAEEALLCYRAIHELNVKIYNVPTSKIIHYEGGSSGYSISLKSAEMRIDGNYLYYLKAFGKEYAIKYLRTMRRIYFKKYIAMYLVRSKSIAFKNYIHAIDKKLSEVN